MRVYYFTKANHALENIEKQRIKISEFHKLNDPFELLGVELSDRNVRTALKYEKSKIAQKKGLICFSKNWHDPVQWAHYAENHSGMCLGFEIPSSSLNKVDYVKRRLSQSILLRLDKQEKLLTTKFEHWEYEQEYRLLLNLNSYNQSNGIYFAPFAPLMELKEVFIGFQSKINFDDVKSSTFGNYENIIIKKTRPAFKDFKIVWDKSKKSLRI